MLLHYIVGAQDGIYVKYLEVLTIMQNDDPKRDLSFNQHLLMESTLKYAEALYDVSTLDRDTPISDSSYYGGLLFSRLGSGGFFEDLVCINNFRPYIFEILENDLYKIVKSSNEETVHDYRLK